MLASLSLGYGTKPTPLLNITYSLKYTEKVSLNNYISSMMFLPAE